MKNKIRLITTLYANNDLLWSLLACFFVTVAMLLAVEQKKASEDADQVKGGNLTVYMEWAYDQDVDVDLWFDYPKCKGCPVFYGHLQTPKAWIGRDDKGRIDSKQNNENATIYDLEAGEYVFNIHAWGEHADKFPASVYVQIKYRPAGGGVVDVLDETFVLERSGQEKTVVRFWLDDKQNMSNKNSVYKPLVKTYTSAP